MFLYKTAVHKHGSHDQKTHGGGRGGRAHPEHGGGAQAVYEALPKKLDSVGSKVDTEFKRAEDFAVANDLATAKTYLWSAGKATGPRTAAPAIQNARLAITNAAKKVGAKSIPKSMRLSDIGDELEALYTGLMMPAGG